MSEKLAKISKKIIVKYPTQLKDLKVGDIVITAELHQIKKIEGRNHIICTDIGEPFPYIKHLGWGQQGILKVLDGASLKIKKNKMKTETYYKVVNPYGSLHKLRRGQIGTCIAWDSEGKIRKLRFEDGKELWFTRDELETTR